MQLRGLYFACGCNEGKVAAGLAFIAGIVWIMRGSGGIDALDIAAVIALTGLGALVGKFAALAAARRILARTLDHLESGMNAATTA